jgi:sulfopyruvate decarboxylase alpha subunit
VVTACREEEGLGLLSGAWLGGARGALIMQNSGLGNSVNTLGSLNVASQIPVVLVISQRGDLGEFNPAQIPIGQATERILDALDIRHVMPRSVAELEAQADGLIKLCYTRSLPVAFILPAELTGGKLG